MGVVAVSVSVSGEEERELGRKHAGQKRNIRAASLADWRDCDSAWERVCGVCDLCVLDCCERYLLSEIPYGG